MLSFCSIYTNQELRKKSLQEKYSDLWRYFKAHEVGQMSEILQAFVLHARQPLQVERADLHGNLLQVRIVDGTITNPQDGELGQGAQLRQLHHLNGCKQEEAE